MAVPTLTKFLRHDWRGRCLLLEALATLGWAKLLLVTVPFRWIAPRLGRPMAESAVEISLAEQQLARRVSWAVEAVARAAPLGFVCLPQAIAAKWMLRRRRLGSTLYLGLRRGEAAGLTAHAWLRAGDQILTGRAGSQAHHTVASFA